MVAEIMKTMTKTELREFEDASKALSTGELCYDGDSNSLWDDQYISDFDYETGATKVCVSVKGMYLKTSYTHYTYYNVEKEDEDAIEICPYTDEDVDYAAVEAAVYQNAVKEGVEKFFAEIESLGNGVYAQRKVRDPFTISEEYPPSEEHTKVLDLIDRYSLDGIPQGFIFASLDTGSTIEELQLLANFIDKFDINDLHDGNMGWLDGHPVFFDYCGFGSSTSWRIKQF